MCAERGTTQHMHACMHVCWMGEWMGGWLVGLVGLTVSLTQAKPPMSARIQAVGPTEG